MIASIVAAVAMPVFAQLSLDDAKQFAVVNSVEVQTAVATVRQREAALQIARTAPIPHLVGDYSLSPQANAPDTGSIESHYFTVGASISINDLIAGSGSIRSAASELISAQKNAEAATLTARENGVKLYFAALQAVAVEGVREDAVQGARRDRAAAELRARSGESPQLDVVRADVTLARARADLARAQADRADAVDALASAAGIAATRLSTVNHIALRPPPPLDLERAVARALAARPELAALLAAVDAQNAAVTAARRSAIPNTTVQGGYQKGVDTGIPVSGPQVAAHVDVPLASGTSARVASAQAQVAIARAQLSDERRRIALEVSAAVRDARAQEAATIAAERARDEARRALDAVEIGYREGASSSLDLADARRTYEQAAVDALIAEYQLATSFAILQVIVP